MSDTKEPGDIKAALDFATKTTEPRVLTVTFEGKTEEVLITHRADGATGREPIRDLFAGHASAPERRKGTLVVHDLATFVAATNRDSNASSVIFANAPARKVTAVLDFHTFGGGAPKWGQDRIEYGFTTSPQFDAWSSAAERPMDQRAFAKLIDDHLGDIGDSRDLAAGSIADDFAKRRAFTFATVADLVVFTRTIVSKSTVDSEEMFDENTGDTSIQYKKKGDVKTNDGQPIRVPQAFLLRIPILRGAEATLYNVAVRLRYDIDGSRIAWRVELHAVEKYINAAIDEALNIVRHAPDELVQPGCGLPVFMGVAPA